MKRFGKCSVTNTFKYLSSGLCGCHESEAQTVTAEIEYILTGGQFGIEAGFVVMGLKNVETPKDTDK